MSTGLFCGVRMLLLALLLTATNVHGSRNCDAPDVCVLPKEESLCRLGFVETCNSAVCFDSDALCEGLAPEEQGFLATCFATEALAMLTNCGCFYCTDSELDREGATDCYGGYGIDVTEPVRGSCEAGGCCTPEFPLCELERYFFFMSVAYGVDQSSDSECSSSLDYFGQDADCAFLTDRKSNDAIVCSNAGITQDDEGRNYCDITFAGTNDVVDVLRELFHLFAPTQGRRVAFGSGENEVSVVALEMLAAIALGSEEDPLDGIMEIAYQDALDKGCFTRENAAIHLMAHSLGAAMANFFALKLAAEYPEVHVKMTTAGEPAILIEPLQGKAAILQVWGDKERYINGRVLPRGQVFDGFLLDREYGLYQDYCWVSQVMPGGFIAGNEDTGVNFLCEVKNGQNLEYFIAGREGCAAGRDDVMNEMPNFPHQGALELLPNNEAAKEMFDKLKDSLESIGLDRLSDIVDTLNVIATIVDKDFRDAFFQILELHFIRRSVHTLNLVFQNGKYCEAVGHVVTLPEPVREKCNSPFSCFSDKTTVEEMKKGVISMRELEIGDVVKNAQGEFDFVYSFGHYAPETKGEYLQIQVSGLDQPLEMTREHMLFVEGSAVPASTIRIGDNVDMAEAGTAIVTKITKVTRDGAFAPFTTSGTIAVNGIAASNYISLDQDSHVLMVAGHNTPLSMHWLAHVFMAPHRLICMFHGCNSFTKEGVPSSLDRPIRVGMWWMQQNGLVQISTFVPSFSFVMSVYTIELMISSRAFGIVTALVTVMLWFLARFRVIQR